MNKLSKKKKILLAVDFIMIVILVALDQFTKYLAVTYLQDKPAIPIIKGVLELNFLKNSGAAFGMLQNQKVFFILVAVLILFIIAYVLFRMPDDKKYNVMHVLLVMIASGAAGNMIDSSPVGTERGAFHCCFVNWLHDRHLLVVEFQEGL